MAKRTRERVPEGLFPADPDVPLDPSALWLWTLRRTPTAAQARAIAAEANERARRAAIARDQKGRAVDQAIDRGDWDQVGEWFAAQRRAVVEPIAKTAGAAALAARDRAKGHQLGEAWNATQHREATRRAQRYVRQARALRKKHGAGWPVSAIIAHIRRNTKDPLSPRQIRRHLAAAGIR